MSEPLEIDESYLLKTLLEMLAIPCPTGFTDEMSHYVCRALEALSVPYQLSRRGTILAKLAGQRTENSRAIVNHIDTIGAQVQALKTNGRVAIKPVGCWSSRFAEGGRVTLFTQRGSYRGQVLPLLASGHAFNEQVDSLPVSWQHVEVRINEKSDNLQDLEDLGFRPGDFVTFDSDPEISPSGYITARHLDNKAGAAAVLAALKAMTVMGIKPECDFYAMFTVTEEVGTGAGAALPTSVAEFLGIDIGPVAAGQNARELGVTLCAKDTSGPFDYHLMRHLRQLCKVHKIEHQVDVFPYYYSDANSAVKAGHDVRDALVTFGTDATHGYERTHKHSLLSIARLLVHYAQSPLLSPLLMDPVIG